MSLPDKIRKNVFVFNILTLISGTAISQAILFFATPLLSRIFTPDDFGVFSVYAAIVSIIASVSSWKYELAIMLPEKEKDVQSLLFLSLIATLITAIIVFLLILVFKPLLAMYATKQINTFIWIVPLGVLFAGWLQVLISFGTKKKMFKNISIGRATQSAAGVGTQGVIGGFELFSKGLIWGKLTGDILAFLYLLTTQIKNHFINIRLWSKEGIQVNAKRYKDFPKYQSFAQFLSSLSQNIPFLLFSSFFNLEVVGFYMLAIRVLHAPTTLIARSTKEVFYQKAADLHSRGLSIHLLFRKTTFGLAKIGIIPFLLFGVFSVFIFSILFGHQWETSGLYAQIIIPWSFLGFLNPPSTAVIYILGMQKFSLKYEFSLVLIRIFIIIASYWLFRDEIATIVFYSAVGVIFNVFLIMYCFNKTKETPVNKSE